MWGEGGGLPPAAHSVDSSSTASCTVSGIPELSLEAGQRCLILNERVYWVDELGLITFPINYLPQLSEIGAARPGGSQIRFHTEGLHISVAFSRPSLPPELPSRLVA